MNQQQIGLIRNTWGVTQPQAERITGLFYARLFALDPSLQHRFGERALEQGRRLLTMMDTLVCGLDRLPVLRRMLLSIGRRYATCGIRTSDYATFGAAWLWALDNCLGDAFSPAARSAWTAFYGVVARNVRQGAHEVLAIREVA